MARKLAQWEIEQRLRDAEKLTLGRTRPVEVPKPTPRPVEAPIRAVPPEPLAPPQTRLVRETIQAPKAEPERDLGRGHSRTSHQFFDSVLCQRGPHAQLLWFHLNRYREGTSDHTIRLNWPLLERRTGLSQSTLFRAAKELAEADLAHKYDYRVGRGKEQGFRFTLALASSPVRETSQVRGTRLVRETDSKRTALKEQVKEPSERVDPETWERVVALMKEKGVDAEEALAEVKGE